MSEIERALDARLNAARQEASINLQRTQQQAAANAARERRGERVRVHHGGHFGPCPTPGEGWISRPEVEAVGGGLWHLDTDQERPSWWPALSIVPPAREAPVGHLHAVE